jgi:hypothetical protein
MLQKQDQIVGAYMDRSNVMVIMEVNGRKLHTVYQGEHGWYHGTMRELRQKFDELKVKPEHPMVRWPHVAGIFLKHRR